jgi:hypothetical protein
MRQRAIRIGLKRRHLVILVPLEAFGEDNETLVVGSPPHVSGPGVAYFILKDQGRPG